VFPVELLNNIRQVVFYYNGKYSVHTLGTRYVKIYEVAEDHVDIGFEDLDEDAGFTPDYDYSNPRIRVFYVDGYLLFSIIYASISMPVYTSWIYYMSTVVYQFTMPGVVKKPMYVLVEPTTGSIVSYGYYLQKLITPVTIIPTVVPSWGENIVKVGSSMKIYATAEGTGLSLQIIIVKPDGSRIQNVMTDLGDGNYVYEAYFDQPGQYLVEVIYPDGFKRKKIIFAY